MRRACSRFMVSAITSSSATVLISWLSSAAFQRNNHHDRQTADPRPFFGSHRVWSEGGRKSRLGFSGKSPRRFWIWLFVVHRATITFDQHLRRFRRRGFHERRQQHV